VDTVASLTSKVSINFYRWRHLWSKSQKRDGMWFLWHITFLTTKERNVLETAVYDVFTKAKKQNVITVDKFVKILCS
jgi:hypothetical protein